MNNRACISDRFLALLSPATWMSLSYRGLLMAGDWRTGLRHVCGRPAVDVVFVSNMRDATDRKRFLGKIRPKGGFFSGPRYWLDSTVAGRTVCIDVTAEDLADPHGRELARQYFLNAVAWAERKGASVVLLAAGTKRLFGADGRELKEKFPGILFTIGDNGTMYLLGRETRMALEKAGLSPDAGRIAVLGPYGLLGEMMVAMLVQQRFNVIGAGPNAAGLEKVRQAFGIATADSFESLGTVDAVVACTHSPKIRLFADLIRFNGLRRQDKKLLVVDVAEPSNLVRREYARCEDVCIRQDAGNAYSARLGYVLGALSYKLFRLSKGVTFGCFAESLALAHALKNGRQWVRDIDWFQVSDANMAKVAELFQYTGFEVPSPRCFGRPVTGYDLSLPAIAASPLASARTPSISDPAANGVS